MTDEEILTEIERQEKRFADAGFGRGLRLAHSAREYYAEMMEMRRRALAAEEECREAEREILPFGKGFHAVPMSCLA